MKIFKSLINILKHPNNINNKFNTFIKLIWWKINQITFKVPAIIEIVPNVKCICYPKSSFGSLILYTRFPEYVEMSFVEKYLSNKSVFIDVGAGIGDYSLIAASKINKGKVISFEPVSQSYNRFLENIRINKFDEKIELFQKVISNKNGYINFSEEEVNEISHINLNQNNENKRKCLSLDFLLKKKQIHLVDLIKIDVEGAESLVLEGLNQSFKENKIKAIIIELNNNSINFNTSSQHNIEKLIENNFICFKVENNKIIKILQKRSISNNKTENIICIHKSIINTSKIKSLLNDFKN